MKNVYLPQSRTRMLVVEVDFSPLSFNNTPSVLLPAVQVKMSPALGCSPPAPDMIPNMLVGNIGSRTNSPFDFPSPCNRNTTCGTLSVNFPSGACCGGTNADNANNATATINPTLP